MKESIWKIYIIILIIDLIKMVGKFISKILHFRKTGYGLIYFSNTILDFSTVILSYLWELLSVNFAKTNAINTSLICHAPNLRIMAE